jgi:hypothetical protein
MLLFVSCSSKTIYIGNPVSKPANNKFCYKNDCRSNSVIFRIKSISDSRRNKENLGRVFGDLIMDKDLTNWLKTGFCSLSGCGIIFLMPDKDCPHGHEMVELALDLKAAYAHTLSTSTSTNLLICIIYEKQGHMIMKKAYRGTYTGIHWWNSEQEANNAFQRAFQDILGQVLKDMAEICSRDSLSDQGNKGTH